MPDTRQAETHTYGADVKQLLKLVAHSLYSHPEIFLRELVSNASDAVDKLRVLALSDEALFEGDTNLKIRLTFDKDAKTITISDNGIGMNREEAIENLGQIARSGTLAFKQAIEANKAASGEDHLIGQFGVGFYSSFIVSDHVSVRTRRAGMKADQGVLWVSQGEGEYTIENVTKSNRGTDVTLHLKPEFETFLDDYELRRIIRKYSDHIVLPIEMAKIEEKAGAEDKEAEEKSDESAIVVTEYEVVNQAQAPWTRSKSDITDEQYQDLYKHISHDFDDALTWTHNRIEGSNSYISLLYIPKRAPFNLWDRDKQQGIKLYVKRIYIMDDAEQIMPLYLRFVKGVVDSNDLPLNVSRELLQSNKTIDRIRSGCTKHVLKLLEKLAADEPENYQTFWKEFGQVLKEGPAEDMANKDRIAALLRFSSTHTEGEAQTVSLQDYISRMPAEQKKIYYIVADSYMAAAHSPLLEVFRKKGIEVLLMSDRIDEWLVSHLNEFEGKTLQSVNQGALDLDELPSQEKEDEKAQADYAEQEKAYETVVKRCQEVLADRVKSVRTTQRLTDSPACVVFDDQDMTGHMQRILKAAGQAIMPTKPILELNPNHPLLAKVKAESDDGQFQSWCQLLLDQALLAEGEQLDNPAAFVKRVNQLLLSEAS